MKDDHKATKSLSIRFPVHILEQMKEIANRHNRSLSGEVLTALEEYIKKNQKGK
ncbi:MAG: Arc family DNA-binding protein [Ktedonobacteraceae bacterium]